ncbi:MAG TPA: SDR family NAD(P)-dependent oxidoreductase, partial [Acidimicrobiales bacterium]|nr:SDR family NAD(P)-dependent oxidoreductase [Acidimicrobiales bacterium]
ALASAFSAVGCPVVLADIEEAPLQRVASALGGETLALRTDVSDAASVDRLADAAFERFGAVHVVCNNAGVSTFNPVTAQTLDDWRWVLGVNLWGVIHGVHSFVPRLLAQGQPAHIVNTSSLAGIVSGIPELGPYNVTKVGVVAISETLRVELAMAGAPVGVSVLCPGSTESRILESERNRPEEYGSESRLPEGDAFREAVRAGFGSPGARTPEQVAARVLEAVRAGEFWVVPSAEMNDLVRNRCAEIVASLPT